MEAGCRGARQLKTKLGWGSAPPHTPPGRVTWCLVFVDTNQPLLLHLGPSLQTNLCDMEVLCSNKGFIAPDETASLPKGTKLVPCSLRPLTGLA